MLLNLLWFVCENPPYRASGGLHLGVSEGPSYSTLDSRILIIRSPTEDTLIFGKSQSPAMVLQDRVRLCQAGRQERRMLACLGGVGTWRIWCSKLSEGQGCRVVVAGFGQVLGLGSKLLAR